MKRYCWVAVLVLASGCQGKLGTEDSLRANAPEEPRATAAENKTASVALGIVVERVPEASAPGKAGIQIGDVLLSWRRLPNPPANPKPAEDEIDSPFDWHDLRIEQAPRGVVEVSGEREGVEKTWRIKPGTWRDVEVQPAWIGDYLALYRRGQRQIEDGNLEDGANAWQELVDQLGIENENHQRLWALFELARFWLGVGREQPQAVGDSERILKLLKAQTGYKQDSAAVQQMLGHVFKKRGDLDRAHDLYSRALEIRQRLAPLSLTVADSLNSLGIVARNRGDLDQAHEFHQRALHIREQLAPESPEVASSLNNLGLVAWNRGDLDQAYEFFYHTLRIDEQLAPASLEVASSLNNLGILATDRGDLDQALEFHHRALRIREQLAPGSLDVADSLNNLGAVAWNRGDLERAYEFFHHTLRIHEQIAPGSLDVAGSIGNLGVLVKERGDLEQAFEFYSRALRIQEHLAPGSLNVAISLNNLGSVATERGDLEQAHEFFTRALQIREQLAPRSLGVAAGLNNLGVVAWNRGDLEQAHELYIRALRIHEHLAPRSLSGAGVLGNLGGLATKRGDLEQAHEFYTRALRIREQLAPESLDVAISLNNLGVVAKIRGNLAQARKLHTHALQIRRQLAPGSLRVADSLIPLGVLAKERGGLDQAQDFITRALQILEQLAPGSLRLAESLYHLGDVTLAKENSDRAALYYLQALEMLEQQIRNLGGSYSVQADYRAQQREFYRKALELLLAQERMAEAFHVLERFRARTFLAMLAERDIAFKADLPVELDRERRRFAVRHDRTLKRLAELSAHKDAEEVVTIRQELEAIDRERGEIEERIRRASPRLAALQYPQPLTVEEAQKVLDPGTLLVSYVVGEESTSIFALSREEPLEVKTTLVGEAALRKKIEQMRELIPEAIPDIQLGQGRTQSLQDLSRDLYKLLLEPVAERIDKSGRLLILPDGPLHTLPFAALIRGDGDGGENDQYLVEWKPLHITLSVTAYAELKKARPPAHEQGAAPGQLAAFGDPSYPEAFNLTTAEDRTAALPQDAVLRSVSQHDFEWRPLPYTRHEVEGIAELFPRGQAQVFLGPDALEERVKNLGSGVRILHLAAHAFNDDRIPLNSFVALTIPEDLPESRDNGLLQAWEILEQVRLDADLVVLSGCLTGMGQELRGEGLIGLTRAFQYAGARSMMSTLWNVSDQATAELMVRFYRHLLSGLTKDEALRTAQLELLREPIVSVDKNGQPQALEHASAPVYWAGVQLYGDWM